MDMQRVPPKVAISLMLDSTPRRNILAGIFSQASSSYNWNITILPTESPFTRATVQHLTREGFDGLILTSINGESLREALVHAPFRTMTLESDRAGPPKPRGNLSFYDNSAVARDTGRAGCDHLHSRGSFRTYAFVPSAVPSSWSENRGRGFAARARQLGLDITTCNVNPDNPTALSHWLASLPKPAAIMAACDRLGVQVLDSCRNSGIKVPEHICVLGVDDDVLLNENVKPALSSVRINLEGIGACIADDLQRNMMHPHSAAKNCRPSLCVVEIVERASTRQPSPASLLVEKALAFIEANATRGIQTGDVVRHLGCSRRLAFLRFSELHGKPIATVIREKKLAAVCRKLRSTRLTLRQIAISCGFPSQRPLENLFRRRFGCTMSAWRMKSAGR